MNESLANIPLRDLCQDAEKLTKELIDHLERNLIPRTRELHNLVRPESPFAKQGQAAENISIRNHAVVLAESQEFTEQLFLKASQYFAAIDEQLAKLSAG